MGALAFLSFYQRCRAARSAISGSGERLVLSGARDSGMSRLRGKDQAGSGCVPKLRRDSGSRQSGQAWSGAAAGGQCRAAAADSERSCDTKLSANSFDGGAKMMTSVCAKARIVLVSFAALLPQLLLAQSGTLGSASSPVVNANGRPMGGVNVAICQPVATTAAQVVSNTAVLTMATNPITAGFAPGMTIEVAGISGADTIVSVTSTTITYSLTHANATATSNGTVLQQGNSTSGCAGLSAIYSDPGMTRLITQPIVTDGYGNWNAFAQSGQLYYVQFYGSGVSTSIRWIMVNVTANAAVKPQASDAVQYVSPNGNDTSDGFSLGSAKL